MTPATAFRIPLDVKKRATQTAQSLGISLSFVVTHLLKEFAYNPKITITRNGFTPEFEKEILRSAGTKGKAMSKKAFLKSLQ